MNRSTLHAVIRQAVGAHTGPDADADADLIRRFAATRDESAFTALLNRHGPMVWAVCRHLLPDPADAEDAFQATFLALVRSAASIRDQAAVGGWLHGVAVKAATKLKRSAARRKQREHRAAGAEADRSVPEATWEALLAAVHDEVRNLPDSLRTVFVLCDLEGARQPDAAAQLGWKPGTLTGRLARARKILLDRLASRGLAPMAAGGLVGIGVTTASGVVPTVVTGKVMRMIAPGGVVPPAVLQLVREVIPMTLTRMKLIAATLFVAGGLATGVGTTLFPPVSGQSPAVEKGAQNLASQRPADEPPPKGPVPPAGVRPGGPPQPGGPAQPGFAPPGGMPGVPPGGMMGGFSGVVRAEWEYAIVEKPASLAEFKKLLTSRGKEGWEFTGVVPLQVETTSSSSSSSTGGSTTNSSAGTGGAGSSTSSGTSSTGLAERPMAVFKRSKGMGGFVSGSVGGGGMGGGGGGISFPGGPGGGFGGGGGGGGGGGNRGGSGPGVGGPPAPGGAAIGLLAGAGVGPPDGARGAKGPQGAGFPLTILKAKYARADQLAGTLQMVYHGEGLTVTTDDRTNSLILRADDKTVAEVKKLLEVLDVEVTDKPPSGTPRSRPAGGPAKPGE